MQTLNVFWERYKLASQTINKASKSKRRSMSHVAFLIWSWGVMDRLSVHLHTKEKTRSSNFFRTMKGKCVKIWQTKGCWIWQMKIGKNTGTRQTATFAIKASSKTCIAIQWLFMILIQGNTTAKATEDATVRQQKINMCRKIGENQKMKLIYGSQTTRKHVCSARIRC